jgi:hypothetical protein
MSTELFRRYIDIINENQQPQQLDEGMIDSVAKAAKAAVQKMSPGLVKKISDFVEQTLGKPVEQLTMADVNMSNIKKVIAANGAVSEADIKPGFTVSGPGGERETAVVPGSLGKNQASYAKIGGILGAVAGAVAPMWAGGAWASNTGSTMAVAAAAGAILIAIIARSLATADRAETGRVKSDYTSQDVQFDPARRDPRLGPADAQTASLPKPQRTGFL